MTEIVNVFVHYSFGSVPRLAHSYIYTYFTRNLLPIVRLSIFPCPPLLESNIYYTFSPMGDDNIIFRPPTPAANSRTTLLTRDNNRAG